MWEEVSWEKAEETAGWEEVRAWAEVQAVMVAGREQVGDHLAQQQW
jgi:hypothetical protein